MVALRYTGPIRPGMVFAGPKALRRLRVLGWHPDGDLLVEDLTAPMMSDRGPTRCPELNLRVVFDLALEQPDEPFGRNLVPADTAERNRTVGWEGAYSFNAPIAASYGGPAVTVAAVRLGEHAHIDVDTGLACTPSPKDMPEHAVVRGRGHAGHLVMEWGDWLVLRDALALHPGIHIAEVENPTQGQLDFHTGGRA